MKRKIKLATMNSEIVCREIGDFVVSKIANIKRTGGVIGLSGGVDSTTTAALTKRAFDEYNQNHAQKLELVGYMLPSNTNNQADEDDAVKVAEKLGIRYEIQNIEPIVKAYSFTNPEAFKVNYNKGNLMSEIRASLLHAKAATENKLLLGTGNKDEDFGIGYYTLFGDGAVHLSPIGNLSKRLVRQMSEYLGFKESAKREPSAGLEPGQTDFKDLGYGYDLIELVTEGIGQGFTLEELESQQQVKSLTKKQIQYYKKIFGHAKFNEVYEVIKNIYIRNQIAKRKSEIIHPPIAPITLEYKIINK